MMRLESGRGSAWVDEKPESCEVYEVWPVSQGSLLDDDWLSGAWCSDSADLRTVTTNSMQQSFRSVAHGKTL